MKSFYLNNVKKHTDIQNTDCCRSKQMILSCAMFSTSLIYWSVENVHIPSLHLFVLSLLSVPWQIKFLSQGSRPGARKLASRCLPASACFLPQQLHTVFSDEKTTNQHFFFHSMRCGGDTKQHCVQGDHVINCVCWLVIGL